MVLVLVIWLAIVNLFTMRMFWQDKQCAIAGARRIPEAELLGFAVVGGSAGALLARHLFRHKTRKQPFSIQLQLIAVVQIGVLAGFLLF